MKQPWIDKAKTDILFILLPPFAILALVFLCNDFLQQIEAEYSFYTWLFFIVFIDVAHVYATLFKTYLVPQEFQKRRRLLIWLPVTCFFIGIALFLFGSRTFWITLAYVAVFHFIRQQYGFMRLYSRFERKTRFTAAIDNLTIYAATLYPMVYWFMSPPRKYTWFIENEFFSYRNDALLNGISYLYCVILLAYIIKVLYFIAKEKYFNVPKNAVIAGTLASWYFGIVYYNNDLVFTMLNIVSHGMPYMALIYFNDIRKNKKFSGTENFRVVIKTVAFYIGLLLLLGFSEEYLWEIFVWNEQFTLVSSEIFSTWHFLLVPLLVVPQFTHYILDGFIWKTKNRNNPA